MPGGGGEMACPARKAPGFTAGQRERVRAFRFGHRLATEAEVMRRLLDPTCGLSRSRADTGYRWRSRLKQ